MQRANGREGKEKEKEDVKNANVPQKYLARSFADMPPNRGDMGKQEKRKRCGSLKREKKKIARPLKKVPFRCVDRELPLPKMNLWLERPLKERK